MRQKAEGLAPAAGVGNSFLFIFILIIWAADDIKNMSIHISLLLLGSLIAVLPVIIAGPDPVKIFIGVLPAAFLLMAKMGGAKIGGADVWAAFVSGIVSGAAVTEKALVLGLLLFVLVKRKGKGAFLPFFLVGYTGVMICG